MAISLSRIQLSFSYIYVCIYLIKMQMNFVNLSIPEISLGAQLAQKKQQQKQQQ